MVCNKVGVASVVITVSGGIMIPQQSLPEDIGSHSIPFEKCTSPSDGSKIKLPFKEGEFDRQKIREE